MKILFWKFIAFLREAMSENGAASASRITSTWLSVGSMSLIVWTIHHMMRQPVDKLQVWAANLPMIIGSLATFAVAPYGVNKLSGMFKKDKGADGGSQG